MIPGRALAVAAVLALTLAAPAAAGPPRSPVTQDPAGPIVDVTAHWQAYQPATTFCVKPDVHEYASGGVGATATGQDPACRRSGFGPTAKDLVKIHVRTPILCAGCRRLFIDFSQIPQKNDPPSFFAHGHVYYHLDSMNWTYTVDPIAHSPNTKNFTNDKLLVPKGSPQEPLVNGFDLHAMSYVSDTAHFIHTLSQGPYYVGPWYLNDDGERIHGIYLDVDVADAQEYPDPSLNEIGYMSGFNADDGSCPSDDDGYYGGCANHGGHSSTGVNPFK